MIPGLRTSGWRVLAWQTSARPMETNGGLSSREIQSVLAYGVDIWIETGREKNLQERPQNLASPLSSPMVISGNRFGDGYRAGKKRS